MRKACNEELFVSVFMRPWHCLSWEIPFTRMWHVMKDFSTGYHSSFEPEGRAAVTGKPS